MENNWISVKDRLPDNLQSVLVTDGRVIHAGAYYEGSDKFCLNDGVQFVPDGTYCDLEDHYSHWQPLPEPPKQ